MNTSGNEKRRLVIILFLVLLFTSLSGFSCAKESKGHEITLNTISAMEKIKTYKLDTVLTLINTAQGKTISETYSNQWHWNSQKQIDFGKNEMQISMQSRDLTNSMVTPYVWDIYAEDGWEYFRTISPPPSGSEDWIKTKLPDSSNFFNNQAQRTSLAELLKTANQVNFIGLENVDNIECYMIQITPSRAAIASWVISQQQPTGLSLWERGMATSEAQNGYNKGFQTSWIRFWIEKDSNLIKKVEINALFSYQGTKDFRGQIVFSDYDKPISINVPSEALNAPENPSQ
jgi:hypothetical protein